MEPVTLLALSQAEWCKTFSAIAGVVAAQGDRALQLVRCLEGDGAEVTGWLLRSSFEGIVVDGDLNDILTEVLAHKSKVTAKFLRDTCAKVKEECNWRWIIMHPDLGDDRIHESRSVFLACVRLLLRG